MRASILGRLSSFFFAVVFLTAAQGQALGLRHCSLHDALPGSDHFGSPAHGSIAGSGPETPGSESRGVHDHHHAQEGQHSGAPGGCMDDCHVGSTAVVLGGMARISSAPRYSSSGVLAGSRSLEGPRHRAYELHLPNAPPLSA